MCPKANIRWIDMNEIITNEQPKPQTEQPKPETEQPKPIQPSVVQPSVIIQPTVQPMMTVVPKEIELKEPIYKEEQQDTEQQDTINKRLNELYTPYKKLSKSNKDQQTYKKHRKFDFDIPKPLFEFSSFLNPTYIIGLGFIVMYLMK